MFVRTTIFGFASWVVIAYACTALYAQQHAAPGSVDRSIRSSGGGSAVPSDQGSTADLHSQVGTPYTVGSGDVLGISVWKEKDLSPSVTVRPDGKISIPLIGELAVVGSTPVQIEELVRHQLQTIIVNPQVTVTVLEIHSRMVYITGEVARPGAYPLSGPLDVLQLIAQAGGLTQFASRKHIRVIAPNSVGQGIGFNYNKAIGASGHTNQPVPLSPGDTVVVP